LNVQCIEKGSGSGGIWYWNCYPGARVDSRYPIYQFTDKEIWSDWTWSERFPGWQEIHRYFEHVESKWQLKKNIRLNTTATSAEFDENDNKWIVTYADGSQDRCRFFIPTLGFAAKKYIPPFKGIDAFKGPCFHSAFWPQEGIDLKNKRVAVIGTGASGVQIIQEIAKVSNSLPSTNAHRIIPYPCAKRDSPRNRKTSKSQTEH
jgi:cation diffusion facilitator CzcD-associated flavoprotein CzcO